jgi:hypothetical protein
MSAQAIPYPPSATISALKMTWAQTFCCNVELTADRLLKTCSALFSALWPRRNSPTRFNALCRKSRL